MRGSAWCLPNTFSTSKHIVWFRRRKETSDYAFTWMKGPQCVSEPAGCRVLLFGRNLGAKVEFVLLFKPGLIASFALASLATTTTCI
jgi:hypothetical protein